MKTASRMTSAQIAAHKKSNPHRKLAKKITTALFRDADRLQLKYGQIGNERSGGGWCKSAVEDEITEILLSNDPGQPRAKPVVL